MAICLISSQSLEVSGFLTFGRAQIGRHSLLVKVPPPGSENTSDTKTTHLRPCQTIGRPFSFFGISSGFTSEGGHGHSLGQQKLSPAPFQKLQASAAVYALAVLEDGGLAAGTCNSTVDLFNASALEPHATAMRRPGRGSRSAACMTSPKKCSDCPGVNLK